MGQIIVVQIVQCIFCICLMYFWVKSCIDSLKRCKSHKPSGLGWFRVGCRFSTPLLSTLRISTLWRGVYPSPHPVPCHENVIEPIPVYSDLHSYIVALQCSAYGLGPLALQA